MEQSLHTLCNENGGKGSGKRIRLEDFMDSVGKIPMADRSNQLCCIVRSIGLFKAIENGSFQASSYSKDAEE